MYSDSDRDRQSDVRAFSDVVDATVSTWFIALHIQLGSLIYQIILIRRVLSCFNLRDGQIHNRTDKKHW
jgi:hypothetical protein